MCQVRKMDPAEDKLYSTSILPWEFDELNHSETIQPMQEVFGQDLSLVTVKNLFVEANGRKLYHKA